MNEPYRYPDYQRDSDGEIPEPYCWNLLSVRAEHGWAYLWDMNGMSITIACILSYDLDGSDEPIEPLDREFEQWQNKYEEKPLNDKCDPTWDSNEEQKQFDEEGVALAHKTFDFFSRTKTVIYYPTQGEMLRLDAIGKPPIRA